MNTRVPKITFITFALALILSAATYGQNKSAGEVDLAKCWAYPTGEAVGERLAADGERIYIGYGGAKVESLAPDGKKLWATDLGGDIASNILTSDAGVFLVTAIASDDATVTGTSVLRSLSKETGITNWTLKLPDASRHFLGSREGSIIVVSRSGVVESIDAKTGAPKWKREIAETFVAEPYFTADKVFVAAGAKQIFEISTVTGEIDSMRKTPFDVTSLGRTSPGETVVGDDHGNVSLLMSGVDKAYWKFKSGGEISSILAVSDHLIVTSHDNFVYFLTNRSGAVDWKKRLTGRAAQVVNVADKYLLTTGFDDHAGVLTDLSTGKVAGQIAFADDEAVKSAAVSADGNIVLLTDRSAYAYGIGSCGGEPNKNNAATNKQKKF